jgi:O-antigen/teichoic acid export membrane protein
MTHAQTVARNAVAIALSTIMARAIQFAWSVALARLLGEAGYGLWGVISGLLGVAATLPEFGIGLIVLRDVAQDKQRAGPYLRAALQIQPILALLAYLLLTLSSLFLLPVAETRLLLLLAGLNLFVDLAGNIAYNQLLAAEAMIATSLIGVGHVLLLVLLGALALTASGGALGPFYLATITAGLARAATLWLALRRLGIRPAAQMQLGLARTLLSDGLPLMINAFANLLYQQANRLLAFLLLSAAAAGNLMTGFVIVFGVVEVLNSTVITALYPLMARASKDDPRMARHMTERLAFLTLVITLPIGVGISGLAATVAALLFPGFASASLVLEWLIWHAIVMMVGNAYSMLLILQNRQRHLLLAQLVGFVVNGLLNLALLPTVGVQGAGVAILIAQSIIFLLFVWVNPPARPILVLRKVARVLLAGLLMAGVLWSVRSVNVVMAGAAAALTYGLALLIFKALADDDWAVITQAAAALPLVGQPAAKLVAWLAAIGQAKLAK